LDNETSKVGILTHDCGVIETFSIVTVMKIVRHGVEGREARSRTDETVNGWLTLNQYLGLPPEPLRKISPHLTLFVTGEVKHS